MNELQTLPAEPTIIPGSATDRQPETKQDLATGPKVDQHEYLAIQAELSAQLDRLNRQMSEMSNQLHLVPDNQPCPELTAPILAIKAEIEAIWDKKRYLERNRCLPEEPTATPGNPVQDSQERLAMAQQKRRLIDERSKLKKKLEDPKAKPHKRTQWETRLVQVSLAVDEIDDQLRVMS